MIIRGVFIETSAIKQREESYKANKKRFSNHKNNPRKAMRAGRPPSKPVRQH
jgi:hypothetical protein